MPQSKEKLERKAKEGQQQKCPATGRDHDYHWTLKGPANFNVKLGPNQSWRQCRGCGGMQLSAKPKRVSKFRRKK